MKKNYLLITLIFSINVIEAQVVNIPDLNFKSALISLGVDSDNDGDIEVGEALAVNYLNIEQSNISSLEGINSFTNLTVLTCYNNNLTTLDISALTNITYLACNNNQITTLIVNPLFNPTVLNYGFNQITNFNVSALTNLTALYCGANPLGTIDVSTLTNLQILSCGNNQLTNLDVSLLTNLTGLYCANNQLTALNVNALPNLVNLYCSNNNLNTLYIKNNSIEIVLDFSNNPNLTYICADTGQLTAVQNQITLYGYNGCTLNNSCSLSQPDFNYYFTIFPNPSNDIITISTNQNIEIYSTQIYNMLGQLVYSSSSSTKFVDISAFEKGNYFLKISTANDYFINKIIKK